ncbi:hypothetical protein AW878_06345 [Bordetella pseudohinzii]|uniref:Uncharacterized protein n=1 Tax=Bordetella pseudohinzii TaxID=1331258 RepID=A0ABM6DJF4_9BORD|nr:hypothetical protein BBN53_20225 [Bordetella pseudohinzii]KMM26335.1 hypothetical protein L540_14735 [Bordetella pseudohinzii]KXA79561.1 hypothetical protein AW877_08745 [Bordetella pseudohinzii]KXA80860.1 hypothetical protein AW878_06345 [Bordetella pseudohinzii]
MVRDAFDPPAGLLARRARRRTRDTSEFNPLLFTALAAGDAAVFVNGWDSSLGMVIRPFSM